ncbi:hypothetical protein ACNAUL_26185 [Raoultella ornithinolytica]
MRSKKASSETSKGGVCPFVVSGAVNQHKALVIPLVTKEKFTVDAIFDIVSVSHNEVITMMSGLDGGNFILSSMAKERVRSGLLDRATIQGSKGEYTVIFDGSEWEGKPLVLCSSRQPYEARVFKSIDGAAAELLRIGLSEASIKNTTKSNDK